MRQPFDPVNSNRFLDSRETTDLIPVFQHKKFVSENVCGELLRPARVNAAWICPGNGRISTPTRKIQHQGVKGA
jgi:hypothetical protein